ncbi:thiamine phosphate synthase [Roseomonas nepalensis]|uniref:Thiamine phosphate synthase n=1 Tax=Muricoccus nepalensis TaxID=1854500 RepID=A0A502FJH2_9PROT|nr:thiamine phosphate synthase [Roseomonas nepalensis]TPG49605.1 thiamine phosphate synthase [Roseomonas nepalensis]
MRRGTLGQNQAPGNRGLPTLWLLSDARRLPDPRAAAGRLPPGSAVLARDLDPALLGPLALLARRRGLRLVLAGEGRAALLLRAGLHLPDRRPATGLLPFLLARRRPRPPLLSVAAHGRGGLARARRLGADLVLLSPVFPTASHPGAPALGPLRWGAVARGAGRPVVALGGVTARNRRRLPGLPGKRGPGAPATLGWAAIGGLA